MLHQVNIAHVGAIVAQTCQEEAGVLKHVLCALQMILITPQDIAAVEDAKKMMCLNENIEAMDPRFVHVVRMQPARENATRS